ncbi:MAG: hypothetical protein LAT55_13355 [Opitutales bacterium]|nr:hypothetical protein [Opitutales bacterium]
MIGVYGFMENEVIEAQEKGSASPGSLPGGILGLLFLVLLGGGLFTAGLSVGWYWQAVDIGEVRQAVEASEDAAEAAVKRRLGMDQPRVANLLVQGLELAGAEVPVEVKAEIYRRDRQPRRGLETNFGFLAGLPESFSAAVKESQGNEVLSEEDEEEEDERRLEVIEVEASLGAEGFLLLFLREENRRAMWSWLEEQEGGDLEWLAAHRGIRNTRHFIPMGEPGGQPLEAIALATVVMLEEEAFRPSLQREIVTTAQAAVLERDLGEMEEIYLDLFTFAARFGWEELKVIAGTWESREALRRTAHLLRGAGQYRDLLAAGFVWSGDSGRLARFLAGAPGEHGVDSLRRGLREGPEVLQWMAQQEKLLVDRPWFFPGRVVHYARQIGVGDFFVLRYGLLLVGMMSLVAAFNLVYGRDEPLPLRGRWVFFWLRAILLGVPFTLGIFLISEPFLFPDGLQNPFQIQFFLEAPPPEAGSEETFLGLRMNEITYLSLLIFFVMQVVVYIICLIKLAEVRRQGLDSPTKLQLLENEENLFDTGLYLGLAGTVGSLIFLALGIVEPSLMAAYASTLFGIVFVAILKIFHVRPFKRRLILESRKAPLG